MERTYIKDLRGAIGKEVKIAGWVDVVRDQGKMVFFDFRDMTGKVQGVVLSHSTDSTNSLKSSSGQANKGDLVTKAKTIKNEWAVKVS